MLARRWCCATICVHPTHGSGFATDGSAASTTGYHVAVAGACLLAAFSAELSRRRISQAVGCQEAIAKPTRRVVVARDTEVKDGDLKQIKIEPAEDGGIEGAVLLARIDGKLYATGASCSHYSAPLAQGVAAKDKMYVVCPWHDAAFDLRTGQPVRGAGLQAIPTYPVSVENGNVVVEVPKAMEDFESPTVVRRDPSDGRTFLVVGGGAAGVAAADSLRQEGYTGRIVLITEERHLPYDRPMLSKNVAKGAEPDSIALRDLAYFEALDIEVTRGKKVASLDAANKVIRFANGEEMSYDCAVVATGATPRKLPIPGGNLPGVLQLRTPEDAEKIAAKCTKGKTVVVVGSSFVGMEVAATLKRRGCDVTVLGMEAVPFERVLGKKVGEVFRDFFQSKGVSFVGGAIVSEIAQAGEALSVNMKGGKSLKCDVVVTGVGVIPNAEFVTGVEKARDGSLITDECLQTSAPGLFAAGDVATYRSPSSGSQLRIEHWDVATSQGRFAARGMAGKPSKFDQTPFFWTSIFGKNLRYVGHATQFDELLIEGDLPKMNFVAFYCLKGEVKAVATMGRDPVAVAAGELMRLGRMPTTAQLKGGSKPVDLLDMLRQFNCAGAA